ncbi:MAG: hypothetical protein KF905_13725 [Flavobacteriales bacterium]|nr:hypothetical protein [Flavobacteriales bacterium]
MKSLTIIFASLAIASCNNTHKLMPDSLATQACECFEQQTSGTIDERLYPCFSKPVNDNFNEIHQFYEKDKPMEVALMNYMMDVTISMIHNCDMFFYEMDSMYTNFYPAIDRETFVDQLSQIQDSLEIEHHSDSLIIELLHRRVSLLTRAREFELAMSDIHTLRTKYDEASETHLVTAYILRDQHKYDQAIIELDQAIAMGNPDHRVLKELVKRRNGRQQHLNASRPSALRSNENR